MNGAFTKLNKPSYEELEQKVNCLSNILHKKDMLISALENSLAGLNFANEKLEEELADVRNEFYREKERADKLFDELQEKVGVE